MTPPSSPARPASALPSVRARVLAFAAIVVAGVCGTLIGSSFERLQCRSGCAVQTGLGAIVGGVLAAGGVAVVAVLTLRAMGEWNRITEDRRTAELAECETDAGRHSAQDGRSNRNPSA